MNFSEFRIFTQNNNDGQKPTAPITPPLFGKYTILVKIDKS
jgi:hypothetical protein